MMKIINRFYLAYLSIKYPNLKLKRNVHIDYKSSINIANNKLTLGNNVRIRSQSKGYHAAMPFASTIFIDVDMAQVSIGDNTRLNGVFIHAQVEIEIGENCVFASGVNIIDSNGHELNSLNRTIGRDRPKKITIGDNVWIGLNSIILKGTSIGTNSVVSAGSVVKGTFPENSIISGNPAIVIDKLIKKNNETSNT